MKIYLDLTVQVDPKAWANAQDGINEEEVPEDVRSYFATFLQDHVDRLGLQPKPTTDQP
jgi:hypothetical protein